MQILIYFVNVHLLTVYTFFGYFYMMSLDSGIYTTEQYNIIVAIFKIAPHIFLVFTIFKVVTLFGI